MGPSPLRSDAWSDCAASGAEALDSTRANRQEFFTAVTALLTGRPPS
jgi:hypothetical protein